MEAVLTYRSNWWGYILKRVFITFITFLLATMLIFFTVRIAGGEFYEYMIITKGLEVYGNEEQMIKYGEWIEQQKPVYHFDEPLIMQYFRWIGDIFTGDWGESLIYYK